MKQFFYDRFSTRAVDRRLKFVWVLKMKSDRCANLQKETEGKQIERIKT